MNKEQLFQYLSEQDSPKLLDLLSMAYDYMETDQRHDVFGDLMRKLPQEPVDGEVLLAEIQKFARRSYAGRYYAPFNINSKNYRDVPEETEAWFDEIGDLLQSAMQVTAQGEHLQAIACFRELYALIDKMEDGEDIVFADELGSWMIPGDEKLTLGAYLTSLAAVSSAEEFAAAAIPFVRRDSWYSMTGEVYVTATRIANEEQRAHLAAEVARLEIRVERKR